MNKFILLAIAATFLMGCNSRENTATIATITANEVQEFIATYDESWGKRDTARMKQIMADSYTYFTSTGSTIDKSSIIGWFAPADKYKVDTASRSEIRITYLAGNTAIVSSRWIGSGTFGNEKFNDDQRCGLVLQKTDGRIRIVAEHCAQIVK